MIKSGKKIFWSVILFILLGLFYRSCVPHKLNEATFYQDENIELKVVRYLEVMPFHYHGPVFRVGCRSENTHPKAWHKMQDRGWTEIPTHSGLSNLGWNPKLEVLASSGKGGYYITDKDTMIFQTSTTSIKITWDACSSFQDWSINSLPDGLVNPEGYNSCLKDSKIKEASGALCVGWGKANCASYRFLNGNEPTYFDFKAKQYGYASFKVSSRAFLKSKTYSVLTNDYGKTWEIEPIQEK